MSQESRQRGSDPIGDFQRWLMRSGARSFSRDVRGNIRKTFGHGDPGAGDVWESATNEEPGGGEPPECEWCPLCRAARKFKDSGPGLGAHLSSAGDIFTTVVQDAVDAFETVISARPGPGTPPAGADSGTPADEADPAPPGAVRIRVLTAVADVRPADTDDEPAPADAGTTAADEPSAADAGPAAAGPDQQAGTGESQERPVRGPDDRG